MTAPDLPVLLGHRHVQAREGGVLLCGSNDAAHRMENPVKVVFLEDVPGTASIGDIKQVKPGFARNYLLPRRMAMVATPSVVKSAEQRAAPRD